MRLTHVALIGFSLMVVVAPAMAEDKKKTGEMDMQAMMETYQKLATPGDPHKQLASMAGSWNTKTTHWMEPDKPSVESIGSCEQKMLLDGRFLQQECTGEMMGSPFTGIGVIGYDNYTKKYVSTWMDSMGTGIYFMEGTGSADGKTITQKGGYNDPIEGPMMLRGVTKIVDNNTEIFEMYGTGKRGKEMKMMEITYTRKP
jgi:hypothetical protein